MTVDTVGKVEVQLMSRILCVSHISARKAETLLGFYNWGFNIWISLHEGWKPEQKEDAEVQACQHLWHQMCGIVPEPFSPPTPLAPASSPALRTLADCPAIHSDSDFGISADPTGSGLSPTTLPSTPDANHKS